jgi:hypothetical protein
MRTRALRIAMLVVLLLAAFMAGTYARHQPAPVARAQNAAMTTCDSSLILLLLLAEAEGYHPMMDTSTLDHGEWTPFFALMMATMEDMNDTEMIDDSMESMSIDDIMASMEMMMGEMGIEVDTAGLTLLPLAIEGEPEECTALRQPLHDWWYTYLYNALFMMQEEPQ